MLERAPYFKGTSAPTVETNGGTCEEEGAAGIVVFTLGIPKVQKNANLVDFEKC